MASRKNGALYTGVKNTLSRRVDQHRQFNPRSHTGKYRIGHLVYYEEYNDIRYAIEREKQIKRWKRTWKIRQIETMNPEWKDFAEE